MLTNDTSTEEADENLDELLKPIISNCMHEKTMDAFKHSASAYSNLAANPPQNDIFTASTRDVFNLAYDANEFLKSIHNHLRESLNREAQVTDKNRHPNCEQGDEITRY